MLKEKYRYSIFMVFVFLTFVIGMIIPASGHGNALTSPPAARLTIHEAGLIGPFDPGTYDDVDSRFSYSGNWKVQTGVTGVTNGTLHLSNSPGNKVEFQFTGNELRIFFQAGPSRGTIRLTLDGTSYIMNQTSSTIQSFEWVLAPCLVSTHTVTIAHDSGGPVNFDAIIVVPAAPGAPTPRPQTFADVTECRQYHEEIEIMYANGLTGGCSTNPLKYCPDQMLNRGQAAVFMLRSSFGPDYVPKQPVHIFMDDWSKGPWAEPWAEAMKNSGFSAGCLLQPLKYCPWDQMPKEQAAVFLLRLKYGMNYMPPEATGTLLADMSDPSFYATAWVEEAYREELLPVCGMSGGKPKICPKDPVSRGLAAYMIVRARNLSMP